MRPSRMRRYPAPPMMDQIRRGSTPTLFMETPYPAEIIKDGYVNIEQRGETVIEKRFNDSLVRILTTVEGLAFIEVDLTQDETLALTTADHARAQLRFIFDGEKTAASGEYEYQVLDISKGGKI